MRLRVTEAALQAPGAPRRYPPLTPGADPATLRPPLVLVSFHVGPLVTVGALLEQLPGELLALVRSGPLRPRLDTLQVGDDVWGRAAAFRRATTTLRRGGSVHLFVDGGHSGSTVGATLFGRPIRLARGPFALARTTGTPMVIVASRWRGTRVEMLAGRPIPPGDEGTMAAAAARWLEDHLRESPGEVLPKLVELLGPGS